MRSTIDIELAEKMNREEFLLPTSCEDKIKHVLSALPEKNRTRIEKVPYGSLCAITALLFGVLLVSGFSYHLFFTIDGEKVEYRTEYIAKEREVDGERYQVVTQGSALTGELAFKDWLWPTESTTISSTFGVEGNGRFSDHINIKGEQGDAVFAIVEGVITAVGFDSELGNYIVLKVTDKLEVKYGHLDDILVEEGQAVSQGDNIAALGKTGMATGPNLYFAVCENGEAINPIK